MRVILASLLLAAVGCGGESNALTGPSPILAPPAAPAFRGVVTETLTGAPVEGFTATLLGARVRIEAPGYVPRETRADATTVDLIREAGFDLAFYRQFARSSLSGAATPLRVRRSAPNVYIQTAGLSSANVTVLEQAVRSVVPALTGGRLQAGLIETGAAVRPMQAGWVVVELVENDGACGRALIGGGHMQLNAGPKCHYRGNKVDPSVIAHEMGHALGFDHVEDAGALMSATSRTWGAVVVSERERHHGAIAYARRPGNLDVDNDP